MCNSKITLYIYYLLLSQTNDANDAFYLAKINRYGAVVGELTKTTVTYIITYTNSNNIHLCVKCPLKSATKYFY